MQRRGAKEKGLGHFGALVAGMGASRCALSAHNAPNQAARGAAKRTSRGHEEKTNALTCVNCAKKSEA